MDEKKFVNALIYAISHERIDLDKMKLNLDLNEDELNECVKSLSANGVIDDNMDGYDVIVSNMEELDDDLVTILHKHGYTDTYIGKCFAGFNSSQIERSVILNDEWNPIFNNDIPIGKVLIRIVDRNRVYHRNRDEIYHAEDMRLAEYVNGSWKLIGPHQKYEYSPVVTREHKIAPRCIVTHYKVPTEDELVTWNKRFNMHNHYEHLSLHIDEENEEMVYDSFTIALAALNNSINIAADDETKHKFARAYTVISDLQALIDTGREINNAVD